MRTMINPKSLKTLFLLFAVFSLNYTDFLAQQDVVYKYVVSFHDKNQNALKNPKSFLSPQSLKRRKNMNISIGIEDVPVNSLYIRNVLSMRKDFILHGVSKWKNCIVIESSDSIPKGYFNNIHFVKESFCIYKGSASKLTQSRNDIRTNNSAPKKLSKSELKKASYGQAQTQASMLNLPFLHRKKMWGQHIHVAIFDGGFQNADTISAFRHLFNENRVQNIYDFASRETEVFGDGDHGTRVLGCMAGYVPGKYLGNAPLATYSLFRTEDALTETIVEEYNWLFAAEFSDSAGVDIVNSSLGYTKFDKDQPIDYSYSFSKLDGKNGIASFAAEMLAKKGVIVCNSAGNSGNDSWKFIGVPADAKDIFSVGAVDKSKNKAIFSSFGPTADNRIKPTICAMGVNSAVISGSGRITSSNGTSFSSPIFCSAMVCLLQKFPRTTPQQFIEVIQSTSSNSKDPNSSIGYGIPDFEKAYLTLKKLKN